MTEEELNERENQLAERERALKMGEQVLAQREQVLTQRIVRIDLAQHLAEAKCRPDAIADAAALMAAAATVDIGEDGHISQVRLGGSEALGAAAAARAFLKARPFLQASEQPATSSTNARSTQEAAVERSPHTLAREAFAEGIAEE